MSLLILFLFQISPLQDYGERASGLSPDDVQGHYQLGVWCQKQGLETEAKAEFDKAILADPSFVSARRKLGHRKISGTWVSPVTLKAVERGIRFPSRDQTTKVRARSREHAGVIDLFWKKENWAVALSRIRDLTGLYTGTLDVQVRFSLLGAVPAVGGGLGGRGTIKIDIEQLVAHEKTIEEFAKKVAGGGRVAVPPAKTTAIITHELTHCFQGDSAPEWFLEGLASYVAGDGHFVHFFRNREKPVLDIEEPVARKYMYARGWGFLEYFRATHGPAAFRKMLSEVLVEGEMLPAVVEEISGEDWASFRGKEQEWTRRWIQAYRKR